MTFRARLVLAATVAVVIAVLGASAAAFITSRNSLLGSVDDSLISSAFTSLHQPVLNGSGTYGEIFQIALPDGSVLVPGVPSQLPVTTAVESVAANQSGAYFVDTTVNGAHLRELVTPVRPGTAVRLSNSEIVVLNEGGSLQLATSLSGVIQQLGKLGLILGGVALGGTVIAVLLGWMVGRTALIPLNSLIQSVEELADTTDTSTRLDARGVDELARLRRSFNRLLEALDSSRQAQRQLVLDASHELRTPLTSLRTNLEVVRRVNELDVQDREVLVNDVLTQLGELSTLVDDLVELTRGTQPHRDPVQFRLDQLVEDAVAIATTHGRSRNIAISLYSQPTWVTGHPDRIMRAVGNLLDNALKWSPNGGSIQVTCIDGEITVRDHGPGISPEDLDHVFDRFYRATKARSLPGSGLGLAIVSQVATDEGGTVSANNAPDGGALMTFTIPTIQPSSGASPSSPGEYL
ncbi:MAG: sensor histidine kinase [Acidimicrobiales bacterium]